VEASSASQSRKDIFRSEGGETQHTNTHVATKTSEVTIKVEFFFLGEMRSTAATHHKSTSIMMTPPH